MDNTRTPYVICQDIISHEKISWAIDSFSPFKSPGPDGIMPIMLQKAKEHIIPWLHRMFALCLSLNHVPSNWRKVKVIFIPKAGRRSHEDAKDFRPISLTSFQLKTLERLIDAHLRQRLEGTGKLSDSQHAYLRGRSTDTALHEVDSYIRFRKQRYVQTSGAGYTTGGVISPLLWIMAVNSILVELDSRGVRVVAYADDMVILVSGLFPDVISDIMSDALPLVSHWATSCGLGLSPQKTELVLFTTRTKVPGFRLPQLDPNFHGD
ncbi:Retrovirus-related Pol polyprotein from type-1 retrotransposable element R1 [Eumeta japonica]|uniref:Retrovirus-related Pol polyprotein from type-1 retrotransposable element R1 n=1 Tax=Eumeta variegata TaxID=151549 RepID=A0A4C1T042_EUMVA|nr:Retrovirus-related Pol polyprotein from type-1 retrotransposable element R1 [Eumeta japonica]